MHIVTNNSAVIAALNVRVAKLELALIRLLDATLWVDSGCKQLGAAEQAAREALKDQSNG